MSVLGILIPILLGSLKPILTVRNTTNAVTEKASSTRFCRIWSSVTRKDARMPSSYGVKSSSKDSLAPNAKS